MFDHMNFRENSLAHNSNTVIEIKIAITSFWEEMEKGMREPSMMLEMFYIMV